MGVSGYLTGLREDGIYQSLRNPRNQDSSGCCEDKWHPALPGGCGSRKGAGITSRPVQITQAAEGLCCQSAKSLLIHSNSRYLLTTPPTSTPYTAQHHHSPSDRNEMDQILPFRKVQDPTQRSQDAQLEAALKTLLPLK